MPIRRLPESLINRIAAGEVVERPASAVKELVENSLDAGAGRIDVIIRDGGQTLIAVSDDGCGLDAEELALAVERHATSKLPDDDLIAIRTLGFRGEALPSIAAVARLTLTSRRRDADDAWSLTVDAGRKEAPIPAAHPEGTRVEVRDLFYATPARLKFLKTPATEYAHAVEAVERLAMAHPRVAFTLGDGARTSLKLPATSGSDADARRDRLARLLGHDFTDNAVALAAEREGLRLSGLAGLPTLNRRNTAQQFLVVNGRPVRDRLLFGAVRAAYQDLLVSDRHPIVALFLELPPDRLDVNVHPMKTEVRFREAAQVRGLIVSALRHALAEAGHRASTTVAHSLGGFGGGAMSGSGGGRWPLPPGVRAGTDNPGGWPVGSGTQARTGGLAEQGEGWQMPLAMPQVDTSTYRPPTGALENDAPGDAAAWAAESGDAASAGEFPLGAALAQLHGTFILARTRDGLVIVDQHAAHERLTHERLINALANGPVPRQALLLPEVIELDTIARDRVISRAADLTDLGLMVEPFGEGAVVVREVPAFLGAVDVAGLVKDLAADLADCDEATSLRERLSEVCATMACHSSVRAGDRLSVAEMNALLRSMEDTPHSGQCSHGRPTYVELKLKDIERLFGRR